MKMFRVNFKKIFATCIILACIWVLFNLKFMVIKNTTPDSSHNKLVNDLDHKIHELDSKLQDNGELLKRLSERVKSKNPDIIEEVKSSKTIDVNVEEEEGNDIRVINHKDKKLENPILPVLVMACNRVTVSRCLDKLIKYRPDPLMFPIIVSQDCGHEETRKVIKNYTDHDSSITLVEQPDLSDIKLPRNDEKFTGYYKIARHYKFALGLVFDTFQYEAVIIVEDDLDISPDFFEYFLGTYPLLLRDPTLWCISAWNDNGKVGLIEQSRSDLLHRTDFFPGLGWMTTKKMWGLLEPKWPKAFFDDWLRDQRNVNGRACIRPEISRTYSFGKVGVSKGLFFDMHLKYIQLNSEFVPFTKLDLNYLLKKNYDKAITALVSVIPKVRPREVASADEKVVKVVYKDAKSFRRAAKVLGLMDDFRSGIPRTGYLGIVNCYKYGKRVYLTPDFKWTSYNPKWT